MPFFNPLFLLIFFLLISANADVIWIQGLDSSSCDSSCALVNRYCVPSGYWPLTLSDFTSLLAKSYDLTTCTQQYVLTTCSISTCATVRETD